MPVRAAALLLCLLAACTSPKKRYEQASQDEAEGRWASAAEKYLDVVRRDPEFPGARERAQVTGSRAIEGWVKVAQGLEEAGRFERATSEYRRCDALIERGASVGVVFDLPPDYVARRRTAFDGALEQAFVVANAALADGRWKDALDAYRRAEAIYEPAPDQRARARQGRFRALLAGAQARMEARRFREALALADQALTVYGAAAELSAAALDLRDRIVAEATVRFVALPVWRREELAARVPAGLLGDLDDILNDEHWIDPPLLVAVTDPRAVRRELRRLEFDRKVLSPRRGATFGQRLGADFVAIPAIVRCDFDAGERFELRDVSRKDGQPAQVKLYAHRTLDVRCAFQIVEAGAGRVVAEGVVEVAVSRRHPHATYDGDMGQVLLSQEEHAWFDAAKLANVDRALEREAAAGLAADLAAAVYGEVVELIP